MARKPKTMMQRRMEFFAALDAMRQHTDKAGYLQGCRAAAPDTYDTEEVRARENAASSASFAAHQRAVSIFNAAIRAARIGT